MGAMENRKRNNSIFKFFASVRFCELQIMCVGFYKKYVKFMIARNFDINKNVSKCIYKCLKHYLKKYFMKLYYSK